MSLAEERQSRNKSLVVEEGVNKFIGTVNAVYHRGCASQHKSLGFQLIKERH